MIGHHVHRRGHGLRNPDARSDVLWLLDHPEQFYQNDKTETRTEIEPRNEGKLILVLALLAMMTAYAPFLFFAVTLWLGAPS